MVNPYPKIETFKFTDTPTNSTFNKVMDSAARMKSMAGKAVSGLGALGKTSTANGYKNDGTIAYNSHRVKGHTTPRSQW